MGFLTNHLLILTRLKKDILCEAGPKLKWSIGLIKNQPRQPYFGLKKLIGPNVRKWGRFYFLHFLGLRTSGPRRKMYRIDTCLVLIIRRPKKKTDQLAKPDLFLFIMKYLLVFSFFPSFLCFPFLSFLFWVPWKAERQLWFQRQRERCIGVDLSLFCLWVLIFKIGFCLEDPLFIWL